MIVKGVILLPRPIVSILNRFPSLSDVTDEEWDELFYKSGQPWTTLDVLYLIRWHKHDDLLTMAYALGRPPWSVQLMVRKLNKKEFENEQESDGLDLLARYASGRSDTSEHQK